MTRLVPVLLLIAAVSLLWVDRFQEKDPPPPPTVDATDYYYPAAVFAHDELRSGRLPLWNPYEMAGQPTLALHAPAVLYPPNLVLLYVLEPADALIAHTWMHLLLAGLFAWLLAARLGLGTAARAVVAVGFLFSPTLLRGADLPPFLSTPVWLPLMLWATHGIVTEGRTRFALALGLAIGLSFLGGHAQGWVYSVQITGLFGALAFLFLAPPGTWRRVLARTPLAAIVALGVAAPQLLPALELAASSVRGLGGLPLETAGWTLFTPGLMASGWAGPFARPDLHASIALPILALPVALCGLLVPARRALFLVCVAMTAIVGLFAVGNQGPVFAGYYALPLGGIFREPTRVLFAYHLFAALLFGLGVDAIERGLSARSGRRWVPAAVAFLLTAVLVRDFYANTEATLPHPSLRPPIELSTVEREPFIEAADDFQRVFLLRTAASRWPANRKEGSLQRSFTAPGYEPNMPGSYAAFFRVPPTGLWHGDLLLRDAQRGPAALAHAVPPKLLDLMSVGRFVTHRATRPGLRDDLASWLGGKETQHGSLVSVMRPAALPRSYAVRRVRNVPTLEQAMPLLLSLDFDPRREAVVIGASEQANEPERSSPPRRGLDRVRIADYTPQHVRLEALCRERCLAILTDLHDPGWTLRVDGTPRPIERTNGIFRGVWLEPGRHELVYRYEPASLRVGFAFLGFTTFVVLLWMARVACSRRKD